MINFLIFVLLVGFFVILFIPKTKTMLIRSVALNITYFVFLFSLFLWVFFDNSTIKLQFTSEVVWLSYSGVNLTIGIDGLSLFFVLLTTFLIPTCLLASWDSVKKYIKEFFLSFFILEILLILVFSVSDILLFYVFFESVLLPMFLLIGIWGSRERKIRAAYMFFLYTLLGSLLMLLGIGYVFVQVGTVDYETLLLYNFTEAEQKLLWLSFFAAFASKIPMLPIHIWLPEAHVEATTTGSVILAGILLKLGSYGFLRFSLPFFPIASYYFTPLIFTLSILGILYTSLTAVRQTDLKRIIAYTSVAHMNLIVMGLFSFNVVGLEGAILQSLSHGFVSSALFLLIGVIYERYHTRTIKYFSGLVSVMPLFTAFFLFFSMANLALPGTSSFVGEFLLLVGIFKISICGAFFAALGMIIGGAYSLWLLNRLAFGNLKIQYLKVFLDIGKRDLFVFSPLVVGTLLLGIVPDVFLIPLHTTITHLIEIINSNIY